MARGGALRGVVTAWLGLIALHAVATTKGSSSRVAQLAADVAGVVDRVLDPSVPAIPDLRAGESWGGRSAPTGTFGTPPASRGRPGIDGVPLDAATRAKYGQGI